jgi:hypothetical protein
MEGKKWKGQELSIYGCGIDRSGDVFGQDETSTAPVRPTPALHVINSNNLLCTETTAIYIRPRLACFTPEETFAQTSNISRGLQPHIFFEEAARALDDRGKRALVN